MTVEYIDHFKKIVLDVMQLSDIDVDDNIYDYGISSILLVHLVASVERDLGQPVSPLIFIENTTIRTIAENIEK